MKHYHIVSRIAIYLLAVIMIAFGIFYFVKPHDLFVYIPAFVPGGILWAYFVGAAFVLGGLSFITNKLVKVSGYVLAVLLIIFVLFVHLPNYLHAGDKEMKMVALINLLKDLTIACFTMYLAAGAYHQHLHLQNND